MGGGDFNTVPDSMFQMNQIVLSPSGNYTLEPKQRMKYARHGHSCCSFGENLIVVTGSRKEVERAPHRTELYNTSSNKWITLADMT